MVVLIIAIMFLYRHYKVQVLQSLRQPLFALVGLVVKG